MPRIKNVNDGSLNFESALAAGENPNGFTSLTANGIAKTRGRSRNVEQHFSEWGRPRIYGDRWGGPAEDWPEDANLTGL